MKLAWWLASALIVSAWLVCRAVQRPNIIFIVADDLGWNDVGFHNPTMITPNIDALARGGVILNQSYVQPVCSPSRTAFMTGLYPFKVGTQHYVITVKQAVCVPLDITFLPQYLKRVGYSTHAIGKWHLGFCNWNCTPTYRGFDSFFGYYNGEEDYYKHKKDGYLDYRDNTTVVQNDTGEYSAFRFTEEAINIIANHDKSTPFFIYLPFQSVHSPIQVPQQYEYMYPNIVNKGRRKFCGMVSALDDAIGNITSTLKKYGVYEDTLIFFTSDNGGELVAYGNNWPLRGGKRTVWEGGTRVTSFVHGARLKKTGYTYNGMTHAVDLLPTILSAAGTTADPGIDGVDQWDAIRMGIPSNRTEFIYNLDDFFYPLTGHAAISFFSIPFLFPVATILYHKHLNLFASFFSIPFLFPVATILYHKHLNLFASFFSIPFLFPVATILYHKHLNLFASMGEMKLVDGYPGVYDGWYLPMNHTLDTPLEDFIYNAKREMVWLFNLTADPFERYNLANIMPDTVVKLRTRMLEYKRKMVPANFPPDSPNADPRHYGNVWSPGWC